MTTDNKDSRSDAERKFDTDAEAMSNAELVQLVRILKDERNCWMKNAKEWEKSNSELIDSYNELIDSFNEYKARWPDVI